ncbi:MAG: hypothetical protein PWP16_943 [Eubacteriaceae bacterium]|jgi:hypothetical protein|nr:hypothetical protein [Eubacteriaceae bacterium]MDK2962174.1 hypothetical protein [Eubacteriaceae bacterium]MDN5307580.1 hypothetical protein [Eubacteriaceae bacterium]
MNVLITMFIGMLYMGIVIALSMLAGTFVNAWLGYLIFFLINTGAGVMMFTLLSRQMAKKLLQFDN